MELLNKLMVVGNLTRDPEVRETASGKTVANLGLAVAQAGGSGGRRDEGEASGPPPEPVFLDVVLWERTAEIAREYLQKGSCILLEGHLQMDRWQDKESGQTRRKLKVQGERIRFLNLGSGREHPAEETTQGSPSPTHA